MASSGTSWTTRGAVPPEPTAAVIASCSAGAWARGKSTNGCADSARDGDPLEPLERVPGGERGDRGLAQHGLDAQALGVDRGADEADVEVAGGERRELVGRRALLELQHDVGPLEHEGAHEVGDDPVERRADEADPEPAGLAGADPARGVERALEPGEHPADVAEQHLARRRERDAPARAREERRADGGLQLADRVAERRLGHVQPLRRAAEVELLRDGDEVAEVVELHARPLIC